MTGVGGENGPQRRRRQRAPRDVPGVPQAGPAPMPHATGQRPDDDPSDGGSPEGGSSDGAHRSGSARPARRPHHKRTGGHRDPTEHGMRDIVGSGRSQLGVSGALRGRDVNRPTDEDLAEAERSVQLVRRNWKPPET